jgi:hypothetical protein
MKPRADMSRWDMAARCLSRIMIAIVRNPSEGPLMSSVVTRIESGRRLRIPAEWGDEFGPEHEVELVRCEEGFLVKPLPKTPVQAALERKLRMNRPSHLDLADMDMDALGW